MTDIAERNELVRNIAPWISRSLARDVESGVRASELTLAEQCKLGEAALAAIEAQGLAVVPVEPTARMVVAGANERENGDMELHARKWRAMLAASPLRGEG